MFKRPPVLYVLIAIVALVLGLLVYLFDRRPEHVYFLSHGLVLAHGRHPLFGVVGNYLPTFVHVYAFILLTAVVAGSTKARLIGICAAWFVVASLFELAQLPAISTTIAAMVPAWFARVPILDNTAAYFLDGTFDVLDLLSIALGTVAAYLTVVITNKVVRTTFRGGQHSVLRRSAVAGVVTLGLLTIIASGGGGGSGTPDTTPPTVVSTSPASAATIVAVGTDITATFSEALTASTVNGTSFTLAVAGGGAPVSATVSYSGTTATLHPNANLAPSTTYTATITTGVKDLAGNAMAADYVWNFTTATDSWLSTTTTSAPTGRSGHTAVFGGGRMIIWGGNDGSITNSGGSYDPIADSWQSTTTTSAPSARSGHTAIWDDINSKMIVWGGDNLGALTNTGGRYDPSTNTWLSTATTGAPSSRSGHTAVWTGSQMIVWGGNTLLGKTNSGGRYDPLTDGWQSTATTGAPSPRLGHAAVWTGSQMIVWGGSDDLGLANSGGRYDPSTNTWQSTATSGAPSARTGHTAVWTGTEMIVWGGNDGALTGTGGRYNPTTDTWQTISTIGAPSARSGHTAIWTGTHMIVWGGNDGGATNTGGIYDPTTDSWQTITVAGAPTARFGHTAVWSGSAMIVWGGFTNTGVTNTGGRYTP